MGLLGNIIIKGVATAATKSIIRTAGGAAVSVIDAKAKSNAQNDDSVVKNGILYIKPTRSYDNYQNENVLEIVQELVGVGFENITLKPLKKLNERAVKKYGRTHSIKINGNSEFLGVKRVPATSSIIIEYLDFKADVSKTVYENVTRIKPGKITATTEINVIEEPNDKIEKTEQKASIPHATKTKHFCSNCGERSESENAKFCAYCGHEL